MVLSAAAAPSNPAWHSHLTSAEIMHLRVASGHLQEDCVIEEERKLEHCTFYACVELYVLQPGKDLTIYPQIT